MVIIFSYCDVMTEDEDQSFMSFSLGEILYPTYLLTWVGTNEALHSFLPYHTFIKIGLS